VRIRLIAVGQRMPGWIAQGFDEYARRLPPECDLELVEIPAGRRGKGADLGRIVAAEGERQLAAVPRGSTVWVLDQRGRQWDTAQLAERLRGWLQEGRDPALLVGGPEGLAPACTARADGRWSLSSLTLPHPLVRVIVAEQLYRAWSILNRHPYHR
jgi:23S rRNA (pseudouridine1915-N3)-methyltransferase